jgi:hypothetical protein
VDSEAWSEYSILEFRLGQTTQSGEKSYHPKNESSATKDVVTEENSSAANDFLYLLQLNFYLHEMNFFYGALCSSSMYDILL